MTAVTAMTAVSAMTTVTADSRYQISCHAVIEAQTRVLHCRNISAWKQFNGRGLIATAYGSCDIASFAFVARTALPPAPNADAS